MKTITEMYPRPASDAWEKIVLMDSNGRPFCYACSAVTCRHAKLVKAKYPHARQAVYIVETPGDPPFYQFRPKGRMSRRVYQSQGVKEGVDQ